MTDDDHDTHEDYLDRQEDYTTSSLVSEDTWEAVARDIYLKVDTEHSRLIRMLSGAVHRDTIARMREKINTLEDVKSWIKSIAKERGVEIGI